jgi:aryl-alcohol dehydrogenase-like predicted oxidoreductase
MTMQYRRLGGSGLEVSTLCLGAMTFGEADEKSFMHKVGADEKTSFQMMDRARERGVNFIDTADVYGQDGLSERVVGRWLADRKARDTTVLATKFRFQMRPGPNGKGGARIHIRKACEDSLERLGTDHIDLYQMHMQDLDAPIDETMRALDDLVRAGKVLYLGCSNFTAHRLMESLWVSDKLHLERFVANQAQYSLLVREQEREHAPIATRFGVGILPWSPLAGGMLSGKYRPGEKAPDGTRMTSKRFEGRLAKLNEPRSQRILEALDVLSKETGKTFTQLALAWLVQKPGVSSVIFGARTMEQLDDNLGAGDLVLTADQAKKLDEASAFELGYPYDFIQGIQGRW